MQLVMLKMTISLYSVGACLPDAFVSLAVMWDDNANNDDDSEDDCQFTAQVLDYLLL